jgi:hypothetical protein
LPQPLAKIGLLPLQPQHLPHYAMQRVNLRSCIAVKEISVSVLQSQSAYRVFATLSLSVHR